MRTLLLSAVLLLGVSCSHISKSEIEDKSTPLERWRKWEIQRKDLPSLDIYGIVDKSKKKPVLVMIQGSKCYPLFRKKDGKLVSPLLVYESSFFRKFDMHVVALERRGIRSFEPISEELSGKDPRARCSSTYGGFTKQERVRDILDGLSVMKQQPWFGKAVLMGHSEGVDVVTAVAKELPAEQVLALGLFSGAAPSNFFDFIVGGRKTSNLKQVQSIFDDLIWMTGPTAEGKYGGYPIARFRSFFVETSNLDEALASAAPMYVANGILDHKAPVEGADLFVVEVLRKQPSRKVHYINYSGLDHDFTDKSNLDHSAQVLDKFITWALEEKKERKFEISEF